jgi:hypothetical protein
MHANQPQVFHYHGHAIAMEVENEGHIQLHNIPVYMVRVNILPGDIDDPETLFGAGLEAAYADVLQLTHRHPDPDDRVQMGIYHDDIRSHHGSFHTLTSVIRTDGQETALHRFVQAWDEVQQSDDAPDLSNGALQLRFTFTLANFQPPGGNHHMGARSKKTMYQREIYADFYSKTDALKRTPFTDEGYCWPMAFLGCQCRRLELTAARKIVGISETKPNREPHVTSLHRTIPITNELDKQWIQTHSPHLISGDNLVLFNPYKKIKRRVNNVYEYFVDDAETVGELNTWKRAGQIIHEYVRTSSNQPELDVHDFIGCGKAYSNVFNVWIHILRVECQLEETHSFRPVEYLPNVMDHIYIVFGDHEGNYQHANAVTNRRKMLYRFHQQNDINVHNYCDICHDVSDQRHRTQSEGYNHITKCIRNMLHEGYDIEIPRNFTKEEYFEKQLQKTHKTKFFTHDGITYVCNICKDKLPKELLSDHSCYIPIPEKIPEVEIPELKTSPEHPNLWVYDIESAQVRCTEVDDQRFLHIPNCICLRPVYLEGSEDRFHFHDMKSFCEFLLSERRLHGATIFAHNGGSYDHQFIIQYLEKNCLPFQVLPRPGSAHKYLSVKIQRGENKEDSIELKDFIVFMPYSLKMIADSFRLPIQKGDFPHKFNNGENDQYLGALPSFDMYSPNDSRSSKDLSDLQAWYTEQQMVYCTCECLSFLCNCGRKKWEFQEEIKKYCWMDTDILASAIQKFRSEHIAFGDEMEEQSTSWQPTPIDPLGYYTQAQAAMKFFLQGHAKSLTKCRAAVSGKRSRSGWSHKSIIWLERLQQSSGVKICHAGNSIKEYFDNRATFSYVDGYSYHSTTGGHIYEFLGCFWHGCPNCFGDKLDSLVELHPVRGVPWKLIHQKTMEKIQRLRMVYGGENVTTIWECRFDRSLQQNPLSPYEKQVCHLIKDREMFFGGRTEVFSPYAKTNTDDSIQHHDVTSMYPYVCAHKVLPIGHPQIFFGSMCSLSRLSKHHSDPYFGYVRCRVVPKLNCRLGLLPMKEEGKLQFDLHPKIGVWFTEEVYLAQSQGYEVTDIFEVLHFDSNNRSNTYFRGYMSFFLRIKQESEGWKDAGASCDNPTDEEKEQVIERLYQQNGQIARMRPDHVAKNPVRRALAKLNLNCLWGKFAQQDEGRPVQKIVYTYDSWVRDIHKNVEVNQESVRYREMEGGAFTCYYRRKSEFDTVNNSVNVWIASAVTAWARCILHSQMIVVGPERILYCDTDSIVFLQSRQNQHDYTSKGLGKWTSEVSEGNEILEFLALAPKCYMKVEKNHPSGKTKAKGVRMTLSNQQKTTPEILRTLLQQTLVAKSDTPIQLKLDHMTIFSNSIDVRFPYASVFTRYAQKIFRVILSKRQHIPFPENEDYSLEFQNIDRIYLAPFSPQDISENPSYCHVYSRYENF